MKYSDAITISLSGGENMIEFRHSHNFYHVQNLGTVSVKISVTPDISGRDDGVFEIPAGGSATIPAGKDNNLYIYGSGRINVAATDSNNNPFRNPSKGGGGGGSGVSSYPELTDLPSINGHTLLGDKTSEELGISGGGTGTTDYEKLNNLPKINNIRLFGNLSLEDLGLIVDAVLSESSRNPVENRVIRQELIDILANAKKYTDVEIANLIDGSETILETLDAIATAMKENHDVVEALNAAIGDKANKTDLEDHLRNYNNPHRLSKSDLGLDKVNNTPDSEKDVRSAGRLTSPIKITINDEEQEFDGSEDIKFNISTGGEGTEDYEKLKNLPLVNGKELKGDVTQEELGWYLLTAEKAAEIVNKAFDKIDPQYITVAEYSLTENFTDGYGLTFFDKFYDTDNYFEDGGLRLSNRSYFSFSVDGFDPAVNDTIIVSMDIKFPENFSRTEDFIRTKTYESNYWGTQAQYRSGLNGYSLAITSKTSASENSRVSDLNVNTDGEWYNLEMKLSNHQRHCEIRYNGSEYISNEDVSIPDKTFDNTENKSFIMNPGQLPFNISIRNLKVMISK